ncbi:MAG: fatty acid desaturase [Gammaproteobacteria bacterium]
MLQSLNHLLSLILPLGTCAFLWNAPHDIESALAWTIPFWMVLFTDWKGPKANRQSLPAGPGLFFDGILYGLTLLQGINIILMLQYVDEMRWTSYEEIANSLAGLIVIRFLVGTSSGTSGIVVAHELIHRSQPGMRLLGRLLLCTVCYEHFVIAHKRGHHLSLGMPDDIATARLGESFRDYWQRVYIGYLRYAWVSELNRLNIKARPVQLKLLKNQVVQGVVIESSMLMAILVHYGWLAAFMFLYQAWAAVRILETVNYFQHWGLEDGKFGHTFGWVTDSWMSRYALIGLSNHIGHHEDEHRHFYQIPYSDKGPKLPYGYFVMNLWVKIHNASFRKMALRELERFRQSQHS